MRVFLAAEDVQLLVHAPAERPLRQHTLDGELDCALRVLLEQLAERDTLEIADIARVLVIELVGQLGPGDAYGGGVDYHDVVTKILMRSVVRLVLALQAVRDSRRQAAQGLASGIDDEPIVAGFLGL